MAIPALALFVLSAAVYMDMNLGTAPYDALSFILHRAIGGRLPPRLVVSSRFLPLWQGAPRAVSYTHLFS